MSIPCVILEACSETRTRYSVTDMSTFSEWLEQEFESRGWNQRAAGSRLDIPYQTINDLLRKPNKTPDPSTLRKLADGLGVSLEHLFDRAGLPKIDSTPEGVRVAPESVRGLSQQSYDFLQEMTPEELDQYLTVLVQQRRRGAEQ